MEKNFVLNGNKIIAKFMKYNIPNRNDWWDIKALKSGQYKPNELTNHFWKNVIQYNTSWDWLMPVIKKLNAISFKDNGMSPLLITDIHKYVSNADIKKTYVAIIQYIEYYNEKNKKIKKIKI